jgi:hypothetical protein
MLYIPLTLLLAQRNWDWESPSSADDQRKALVNDFLKQDTLDPALFTCRKESDQVSRVPTEPEIEEILQPFRPQHIRQIAHCHCAFDSWSDTIGGAECQFTFLRTHYGADRDEDNNILDAWVRDSECFYDRARWWALLEDAELFDMGDDWERVYTLLPELAVRSWDRRPDEGEDISFLFDAETYEEMLEDKDEVDLYHHVLAVNRFMVLFDREFFATQEAALVFRDKKGRPIRTGRIPKGELGLVVGSYVKASLNESSWWTDSVVGERYKAMLGQE